MSSLVARMQFLCTRGDNVCTPEDCEFSLPVIPACLYCHCCQLCKPGRGFCPSVRSASIPFIPMPVHVHAIAAYIILIPVNLIYSDFILKHMYFISLYFIINDFSIVR